MESGASTPKSIFEDADSLPAASGVHRWRISLPRAIVRIGPLWWMLFDAALALLALKLGYTLSPFADPGDMMPLQAWCFPPLVVLAGAIAGIYEWDAFIRSTRLIVTMLLMTALAIVALTLFMNLVPYVKIGRWVLVITGGIIFLGAGLPRYCCYLVAKYLKIKVLLVGDKLMSSTVARQLARKRSEYALVGFCSDSQENPEHEALGGVADIQRICHEHKVSLVVVTDSYTKRPRVLDQCFEAIQLGCDLVDEFTFFERAFQQVLVDQLDPRWFYAASLGGHNTFQALIKRSLDIIISASGLLLLALFFPLIWAAIRLTSWGPVFYTQTRCGQFGRPFTIYKFRTMEVDAETGGAQWASESDTRVTPIGYFLRKTRLDEAPQFWNILKGEMSFVGPRPERPEFVAKIEEEAPFFSFRHWARPGLTGLAQIRYRYGSSVEDAKRKLQHDLFYIKNWSIMLDLQIILRTFSTIMKGAR